MAKCLYAGGVFWYDTGMDKILKIALASLVAGLAGGGRAGNAAPAAKDWSRIYLGSSTSVAPDGSFFVFEWCGHIWRAPAAGGTATPLTSGDSYEYAPCVSPDGARVAFMSNRAGGYKLFEMDLPRDGRPAGALRQVSFNSEGMLPCGYTPDGRYMTATGKRDFASGMGANLRESTCAFLASMDGSGREEPLFDAPATRPAVSPDGSKVLFVYGASTFMPDTRKRLAGSKTQCNTDIWLYDRKARTFAPAARTIDNEANPMWAPDGKGFYYTNDRRGVRNIHFRRIDGGGDRELTHFTREHVYHPSLSRDGRTMVFRVGMDFMRMDPSAENPAPEPVTLHPAGTAPGRWREYRRTYSKLDNDYGQGNCSFAGNGDEVAFTAGGDVWVMDAGKREPALVHGSSRTHERDCCFSPDGNALYYLSDRGDGTDVWVAHRADPAQPWSKNSEFVRRRLASDGQCRRNLSVSPDGATLAWTDLTGIITFAGTNARARCVSKVPATSFEDMAWSPDGKYVAASLADGYLNTDIWIIPSWEKDGKGRPAPEPYNVSRNIMWDCNPAWSPDGRILAFCGERKSSGGNYRLFYVYLDPADEDAEAAGREPRKGPPRIVFDGLYRRVRNTGIRGWRPCFSHDGRTLAYSSGGKTHKVKLPDCKNPEKMLDCETVMMKWLKLRNGERQLCQVDRLPAHGGKKLAFTVRKTVDILDYLELGFLSAWATLRNSFYDPSLRGMDWEAVREKYAPAARNAPDWSVFRKIMSLTTGEIDASHNGYWENASSPWPRRDVKAGDWQTTTAHTGARLDPAHRGEGWLVKDVVPRSPAARGAAGLMPGDIILSVDGKPVSPETGYAPAMNVCMPHKFRFSVKRAGEKAPIGIEVEAATFETVRKLMREAGIERMRDRTRAAGNFGYLAIDAMDSKSADAFADEAFAECFGKDGVVIDVRFNCGGFVTDRLLDMLCGQRHVRCLCRGAGGEGYVYSRFGRPVLTHLPVVALANQHSMSNAEEFSHAMQTLKRAKLVGRETCGEVIGTNDHPLFDLGTLRRPRIGFFLPDGTDMEWHGAKPDVPVDITPADIAAGRDPQLDAAIETLRKEAAAAKANPPPPLRIAGRPALQERLRDAGEGRKE